MSITFRTELVVDDTTGLVADPGGPQVNVHTANACAVLERLGYDFDARDPWGDADATDLLGRAMVANVGRDDSGADAYTDTRPGMLTVTVGAVRPGRIDEILAELADLAVYAQAKGVRIQWN